MRPVQPRQRLHRLDARKTLVHVHAAEERLVEARLELVRDEKDAVVGSLNASRISRPLRPGFSTRDCSVNGSGDVSRSSTSPENATKVPHR
jgi:hypothetical protein